MRNGGDIIPARRGATSPRSARTIVIAVATLCALVALYVAFRSMARRPAHDPIPRTYRLRIEDQRLTYGPPRLSAVEGDSITLVVTSNRRETLHVHEYEQHLVIELTPGREMTSTFSVDRAGRFGVHLIGIDGSHAEVAVVEVLPR